MNYLNLKKRVNTEVAAHHFFVDVLKNQKQPWADVLVLESLFNKVAGLQLSFEYCESFSRTTFFIEHVRLLLPKN